MLDIKFIRENKDLIAAAAKKKRVPFDVEELLKLDDEYFRFWVTAGAHPNTKLSEVWKDKVVGSSFKRSPALLRKIQDDHKRLILLR